MNERVSKPKRSWIVGVAVVGIALAYVYLLASDRRPEPGPNLVYETAPFEQVDEVESRFEESAPIAPGVESPKALATAPDGTLYVAGKDAVAVLDAGGAEVERIALKGTPTCLGLAPDGTLLVGLRDRIAIIKRPEHTQSEWPALNARTYITSIAATNDDVFAADAGNRVVLRYGWDGTLRSRIGQADPARDVPGLLAPSPYLDVALDADGALWVANPGRLGLESYRADGDLITSWYRPSLKLDGFSGCCNPSHIAFRSDGKLVTCEKGLVRVKVYEASSGAFEELVAGTKSFPREQAVRDLAVDNRDRVLVLDSREDVVRVFQRKDDADDTTNQPA